MLLINILNKPRYCIYPTDFNSIEIVLLETWNRSISYLGEIGKTVIGSKRRRTYIIIDETGTGGKGKNTHFWWKRIPAFVTFLPLNFCINISKV